MAAKPTILPRKPGHVKVTDSLTAQRFLSGAASESLKVETLTIGPSEHETSSSKSPITPGLNQANGSKKRVLTRSRDGKTVRQVTAYLPVELSKALAHYCAEYDVDKSEVIVSALQSLLEQVPA